MSHRVGDKQAADEVRKAHAFYEAALAIKKQLRLRVVGQDETIEQLLVTLFSGGHALFVGVPGLAKTRLVQALADALSLSFGRVQFTPDLMPADITGVDILEEDAHGRRSLRFRPGPVFVQLLLADEINRTPPKTQAALLEAMQEKHVTCGGTTYPITPPFHVFATQNPVEQEGTYPLPEAQLDRFMMRVDVSYPTEYEEITIVKATASGRDAALVPVLSVAELLNFQELVGRVPIDDANIARAVRWVRRTRPSEAGAPVLVKENVAFGAGPRASQHLVTAAKARALLHGRFAVDVEDLMAVARPVLRHRLVLNFSGQAQSLAADDIIATAIHDDASLS